MIGSGADPSAPVTMRNKMWHDAVMGTFKQMPPKDTFGIPKDKSSLGERPKGRNLWASAQWIDALTTVQYAVRNRPKNKDRTPMLVSPEGD